MSKPFESQMRIARLMLNEKAVWVCHNNYENALPKLVNGWDAMVRTLTIDCIDFTATPEAILKAESWLTGTAGTWVFKQDGSVTWFVRRPDGIWMATTFMPSIVANNFNLQ